MERVLTRNRLTFMTLLAAAALGLSACAGGAPDVSWPGLAASDQLAFVVYNQQVHAVDLTTHQQAWAFPPTPNNNTGMFFASPGVSAEVVVVGSEGPLNSYSGVVYGVNPATGNQLWCLAFDKKGGDRQNCPLADASAGGGLFGISAPNDNRVIGGISLSDGAAYFGLASGRMYAVEAASGKVLWSFSAEHAVWAAPVVDDGTVYVASLDHKVYALDRKTGEPTWTQDLLSAIAGTPALAGNTLYVGTFGSRVVALDTATGDEKWSAPANQWVWGGPVVAAGTVYFTDLSGTVFAVDAAHGTQKWAVTPGGVMTASPALTADALYVGDRGGKLFALDPATGAVKAGWPLEVGGELLGAPIIAGEAILIAPHKGENLLAAYQADGTLAWPFAPSK